MVKVINPDDIKGVSGGEGHGGVELKILVDKRIGAKNVGLAWEEIAPGGLIEPHRHSDMEHCYYVVKGELTMISDLGESQVKEGMIFWIGINEMHGMANESEKSAVFLNISAPPPDITFPESD